MKKYLLMFMVALGATSTITAQESAKQIFEIPDLQSKTSEHKIVAILPFDVSITYRKQPKNFSLDANKEQEKSMSKSIQSSMYTFVLRKADNYSVEFQDVDKTNILLKKAGISDKLDESTRDEIAKILGVDAVIGGKFDSEQSRSEGAGIATALLFGSIGGKTGSGTVTLSLNNGADGKLLWRFFKTMDDNVFSSTDDLVERMMRKVSRNFPYIK